MKRISTILLAIVSLPLFSMEIGAVRILKKSDPRQPKPLVAYYQSQLSFIERYEALKKRRVEGQDDKDHLMAFLVNHSQVVCIRDNDAEKKIKSQLELSCPFLRMNNESDKALLYAALTTSGATYQVLKSEAMPRVSISLAGGYSFVGPTNKYKNHMFGDIPWAIAKYAEKYWLKKILIIDENSEKDMRARVDYYLHGNGAIFYGDEQSSIFNDVNIVVANQIPCLLCEDEQIDVVSQELLEKYLAAEENVQHKFDLAYYVVRLKNLEKPITEADSSEQLCNNRIYSLLDKHIPTVVVFSGDVEKHSSIGVRYIRNIFDYAQQVYNQYQQQ